jgi:putative modified peptide
MPSTKLTPDLVDKLLDKLGNDDAFRNQFVQNPDSAIRQLPGAPQDFTCGGCTAAKLVSKEQIQKTRLTLAQSLLSKSSYQPHLLKAD